MNEHADISLRDLYLILRRGLPLIVGAALAAGVIAFVIGTLLPTSYSSVAVAQVTPSPIGAQEIGGLDFNPRANLSFEAYESIAFSAPVLKQTLEQIAAPSMDLEQLRNLLSLRRLAGPTNPDQVASLTIEHEAQGDDPDAVVRLASVWSIASIEGVRSATTSSLTAISETTAQSLEQRERAVEANEGAWQAFQASDTRNVLGLRLADVDGRLASNRARIDQLERLIAIASAGQAFLRDQLGVVTPDTLVDTQTQLDALADTDLISPSAVNQLRVLFADHPDTAATMQGDLLTLLIRAELQQQTSRLVEHIAERDVVADELDALERQAETLRNQIAELDRTATTLQRSLQEAIQAYNSVVEIVPIIDYATELSATSIGLLSSPTDPPSVLGRGATFLAALTTVVAGLLMVLYTFLREAVREPNPPLTTEPRRAGNATPPHVVGGED